MSTNPKPSEEPVVATTNDEAAFEQLLTYLRESRGFDFTAYKPMSLRRRVQKRNAGGSARRELHGYTDYLEVHPDEFQALFNTILINVTAFFRDEVPWGTFAPRSCSSRDAPPSGADSGVDGRLRLRRRDVLGRHAPGRGARR